MNSEKLYEVLGEINEKYVKEAKTAKTAKRPFSIKWGVMAACFAIMLMAVVIPLPMILDNTNTPIPPELKYEKGYFYHIDDDAFAAYVGGKVITEDKIGYKLADVIVTAGWKNDNNEWISTEKLRGQVYTITGISSDIAVALKFLDKGEAVTTTHYYVIMNPEADLTSVEDYIITPIVPYHSGGDMSEIVLE